MFLAHNSLFVLFFKCVCEKSVDVCLHERCVPVKRNSAWYEGIILGVGFLGQTQKK